MQSRFLPCMHLMWNTRQLPLNMKCRSVEEFQKRIGTTLQRYPYLVSERGKEIVGFAYLSPFKGRAAYDWSAEVSIYVKDSMRKCGIGRRLYEEIERIAREQHLLNLNACIGYPEKEDEY